MVALCGKVIIITIVATFVSAMLILLRQICTAKLSFKQECVFAVMGLTRPLSPLNVCHKVQRADNSPEKYISGLKSNSLMAKISFSYHSCYCLLNSRLCIDCVKGIQTINSKTLKISVDTSLGPFMTIDWCLTKPGEIVHLNNTVWHFQNLHCSAHGQTYTP